VSEVTVIGELLNGDEERDAIHVAVAPVVAGERLYPGQHIGLSAPGVAASTADKLIGVVDAFLKHPVLPGERCWMFLYPYTITSLRHRWTHPDFETAPEPEAQADNLVSFSASEKWLRAFAERCDITYRVLMDGAKDWLEHHEYLNQGETLEGIRVPDEFWEHYEKVSGKAVDEDKKESFFTCSC
jgi:hypothetical protein